MPLHECFCPHCGVTFEVLASQRASAAKSHPCPECGRRARRLLSTVTFGRNGSAEPPARPIGRPDVTGLKVPPPAQLCWMDERSSARYAAYLHGRGAEYDDTVAARAELANKHGTPADQAPARSHSPLTEPAVYARRRAAAKRSVKDLPAK